MFDSIPEGKRLVVWRKYYLQSRRRKGFRTICEVLREVYLDAEQRGDTVTMSKMDEATDMAKRMQARLEEHKAHGNKSLIHFENGFFWLSKDRLFEITENEINLIETKRIRAAEREAARREAAEKAAVDSK